MAERNDSRTLNSAPVPARLLGLREVMRMTGLSRSSIYDLRARGRFPQPVRVTEHAVRWIEAVGLIPAFRPAGRLCSNRRSALFSTDSTRFSVIGPLPVGSIAVSDRRPNTERLFPIDQPILVLAKDRPRAAPDAAAKIRRRAQGALALPHARGCQLGAACSEAVQSNRGRHLRRKAPGAPHPPPRRSSDTRASRSTAVPHSMIQSPTSANRLALETSLQPCGEPPCCDCVELPLGLPAQQRAFFGAALGDLLLAAFFDPLPNLFGQHRANLLQPR